MFAVVFSAVFSIVGVGIMSLISRGNQLHTRDIGIIKSYWANEGAVRVALRYLTRATSHPPDITNFNVSEIININDYKPTVFIDALGNNRYDIISSVPAAGLTNTTTITDVSFNTFSWYTWFQDGFQAGIRFGGVFVYGNMHSNEYYNILKQQYDYQPGKKLVTKEATCADLYVGGYPKEYGNGVEVFGSGVNLTWLRNLLPDYTTADQIPIIDFLAAGSFIDVNGWNLDGYGYNAYLTWLRVDGVGKVRIYGYTGSNWTNVDELLISDLNSNNSSILKSTKPIHVAGTLMGELTIASYDDIFIAGDILYDGVPTKGDLPSESTQDILGLVCGKDILIQQNYTDYDYDLNPKTDGFPFITWTTNNFTVSVYASLFVCTGRLKPDPDPYHYPWPSWETIGRKVKIYGSCLIDELGIIYDGIYPNWTGFNIHTYGDPRLMKNKISPPGLPAPGIPGPEAVDSEMINHWGQAGEKRYPIDIGSWKNEVL